MRAFTRLLLLFSLIPLLMVLGCQRPAPDSYVHGAQRSVATPAAQVSIGKNSVGEDCTQEAEGGQSADVFCGTWQQPSAHIRSGGAGTAGDLAQLAAASPWRSALDTRFRCDPPVA